MLGAFFKAIRTGSREFIQKHRVSYSNITMLLGGYLMPSLSLVTFPYAGMKARKEHSPW